MGLENTNVLDAVGTEVESGCVVLSIFDSWTWEDEDQHLAALQDKLNAYFEFIESEQIKTEYPSANGRQIRIDLLSRFPIPPRAESFLEMAADVASELGVAITQRQA
jgi:hypothetical protein